MHLKRGLIGFIVSLGSAIESRGTFIYKRPNMIFLLDHHISFQKNLGGHYQTVEISRYGPISPIGTPKKWLNTIFFQIWSSDPSLESLYSGESDYGIIFTKQHTYKLLRV